MPDCIAKEEYHEPINASKLLNQKSTNRHTPYLVLLLNLESRLRTLFLRIVLLLSLLGRQLFQPLSPESLQLVLKVVYDIRLLLHGSFWLRHYKYGCVFSGEIAIVDVDDA